MNSNKLKAAAVMNNLKMREIINALHISPQSFYRKMAGQTDFKLTEIRKLKNILRLTDQQVNEIFFDEDITPPRAD